MKSVGTGSARRFMLGRRGKNGVIGDLETDIDFASTTSASPSSSMKSSSYSTSEFEALILVAIGGISPRRLALSLSAELFLLVNAESGSTV